MNSFRQKKIKLPSDQAYWASLQEAQRCKQQNPDFRSLYRTNDLVSLLSKLERKKKEMERNLEIKIKLRYTSTKQYMDLILIHFEMLKRETMK